MTPAQVKLFLPQFMAMLAELRTRPNIPLDVIDSAQALLDALVRWTEGT